MQVIDSVHISADTTIQLQFNLVYNDTVPIFECPHGKSNICEVHGTELNQIILPFRHPLNLDSENLDESDAEIYNIILLIKNIFLITILNANRIYMGSQGLVKYFYVRSVELHTRNGSMNIKELET